MLVRLSETDSNGTGNRGFRYAQARSNGSDLRFLDKSGSELKYEIANWNPAGESHIWVNIPSLKSDANITMYWGNPSAGLPTYANDGSVWKDYFGVYHLEQNIGSAQDSSPLNNHLTSQIRLLWFPPVWQAMHTHRQAVLQMDFYQIQLQA